ncbi:MAG: hypothetical protein LBC30_02890 [Puniceicoccales bacterium]|nr:hypothetical protein [Puniceicoccales bacterium]
MKRKIAIELCARFSLHSKEILSRLTDDGDCVYLTSGWASDANDHCAHMILEQRGQSVYAHEMNAGGGTASGERTKSSKYGNRITPGRTIRFASEKDVLSFISCAFELKHLDHEKSSGVRSKEYVNMWEQFG